MYYWLGTYNCELKEEPDYIILMGGGGMPSPDGLIRTYYTAGAWHEVPVSKVIIAIPPDTSNCFGSPEVQMKCELIMRGVDSTRIIFEPRGHSTYTQAMEIARLFGWQVLNDYWYSFNLDYENGINFANDNLNVS